MEVWLFLFCIPVSPIHNTGINSQMSTPKRAIIKVISKSIFTFTLLSWNVVAVFYFWLNINGEEMEAVVLFLNFVTRFDKRPELSLSLTWQLQFLYIQCSLQESYKFFDYLSKYGELRIYRKTILLNISAKCFITFHL